MKSLAVIPSRYPSTRLPGKPLVDIAGKTLVQRVWEQTKKTKTTKVVIATDDEKIEAHGKEFGAEVVMTSSDLQSGTDRVAQTYEILKEQGEEYDFVTNVQGDLPLVDPNLIDTSISNFANASADFDIATAALRFEDIEEYQKPSSVKVVTSKSGKALYFSRASIPFNQAKSEELPEFLYKHIGLYIFRPEALLKFTKLEQTYLEKTESLEQLRALENDFSIYVSLFDSISPESLLEVNVPEDVQLVEDALKNA